MKLLVSDSGKVKLAANGKLADKNCCCCPPLNPCTRPTEGDCIHYLAAEVKIHSDEVAAGGVSGDFISLVKSSSIGTAFYGVYFDYDTSQWVGYGPTSTGTIDADPNAGCWHSIQLMITAGDCPSLNLYLCVDGQTTSFNETEPERTLDTFLAGSYIAGPISKRSIRNIAVVSIGVPVAPEADGEPSFFLPAPDTFDSFGVGVSVDAAGVLQVDAAADAYAEKNLSDPYDLLACTCCPEDGNVTDINSITLKLRVEGYAHNNPQQFCDDNSLDPPVCRCMEFEFETDPKSWSRVDQNLESPTDPGDGEFKNWCKDCVRTFEIGSHLDDFAAAPFCGDGNSEGLTVSDTGILKQSEEVDCAMDPGFCEDDFGTNHAKATIQIAACPGFGFTVAGFASLACNYFTEGSGTPIGTCASFSDGAAFPSFADAIGAHEFISEQSDCDPPDNDPQNCAYYIKMTLTVTIG